MIGPGSDKTESGGFCGLVFANISHVLPPRNIVTPQLLTSTGKLGSFESEISLYTMRKKETGEFSDKKYSGHISGAFLRKFLQFFSHAIFSSRAVIWCLSLHNFFHRKFFFLD